MALHGQRAIAPQTQEDYTSLIQEPIVIQRNHDTGEILNYAPKVVSYVAEANPVDHHTQPIPTQKKAPVQHSPMKPVLIN